MDYNLAMKNVSALFKEFYGTPLAQTTSSQSGTTGSQAGTTGSQSETTSSQPSTTTDSQEITTTGVSEITTAATNSTVDDTDDMSVGSFNFLSIINFIVGLLCVVLSLV